MTFDPTRPLYETDIQALLLTAEQNIIQAAVKFLHLTSPNKMFSWKAEDDKDAMEALGGVHEDSLREAFEQLKSLSKNKSCDFGDYYRLASSIERLRKEREPAFKAESDPNDWRERDMQKMLKQRERERNAPKRGSREWIPYWKECIGEDLKTAGGLSRGLPYDKSVRVYK